MQGRKLASVQKPDTDFASYSIGIAWTSIPGLSTGSQQLPSLFHSSLRQRKHLLPPKNIQIMLIKLRIRKNLIIIHHLAAMITNLIKIHNIHHLTRQAHTIHMRPLPPLRARIPRHVLLVRSANALHEVGLEALLQALGLLVLVLGLDLELDAEVREGFLAPFDRLAPDVDHFRGLFEDVLFAVDVGCHAQVDLEEDGQLDFYEIVSTLDPMFGLFWESRTQPGFPSAFLLARGEDLASLAVQPVRDLKHHALGLLVVGNAAVCHAVLPVRLIVLVRWVRSFDLGFRLTENGYGLLLYVRDWQR